MGYHLVGMSSDALLEMLEGKTPRELLIEYIEGGTFSATHPVTEALIRLELHSEMSELTKQMKEGAASTYREVSLLSESSNRMEGRTHALKMFTIWLLVFVGIQMGIGVIQTWKMLQPERPIQVVVQVPPTGAGQAPALPLH